MKKRIRPIRTKLPKATQEMKDTILAFFNANKSLKKKTICRELCIPLMAIYTAARNDNKSYISYAVATKLLTYIENYQKR
jgi:hypothetical protein